MRSRLAPWLAVVTLAAAGIAAAAGYGLTAPRRYTATAQILVSPVSPSDQTFEGLGVLRDTGGKRTAAADVAALLRGPQVADAVAAQLALRRSRGSLQKAVDADVVGSSDVVAVDATDTTPTGAAELANAFANVLIAQRSASLQSDLQSAIKRDERLVAAGAGGDVARRLTTLRGLIGHADPTLRVASEAASPSRSTWPNRGRLMLIGGGIGAAAGVLVAAALLVVRRRRGVRSGNAMSDDALDRLVDRLEAKLAARESALAARERDLQRALADLRAAQQRPADEASAGERTGAEAAALAQREAELAERVAAVQRRELEVARRAAELTIREREAARRPEPAPEPELEPEPEPAAAAEPLPAPVGGLASSDGGHYNLVTLERLVDQHGSAFPDRAEEWVSYLYFLREYAAPDGTVPAAFDGLIQDTFSELVA